MYIFCTSCKYQVKPTAAITMPEFSSLLVRREFRHSIFPLSFPSAILSGPLRLQPISAVPIAAFGNDDAFHNQFVQIVPCAGRLQSDILRDRQCFRLSVVGKIGNDRFFHICVYRRFLIPNLYCWLFNAGLFEWKGQYGSFRFKLLSKHGRCPPLFPPDPEDVGDSAAGTPANVDQVEHLLHGSVPGIRDAAAFCRVDLDAEAARIGHHNAAPLFDDGHPLSIVIVRMDQTVFQSLAERLVNRGIVHSDPALHFEGHLEILYQLVVDPENKNHTHCRSSRRKRR